MHIFVRIIRLILKIVFFTLSFGLIAIAIFYPSLLKEFIQWLQGVVHLIGRWNYPLSFGLGFIESVPLLGMTVPGQNALFVIGGFVAQQHWGVLICIVATAIILGDVVGYVLGKYQ